VPIRVHPWLKKSLRLFLLFYSRSGHIRYYQAVFLEELSFPVAEHKMQSEVAQRVRNILAAKKADPATDVSALEAEIDQMVYKLYDLTEEEIAIVEGKK